MDGDSNDARLRAAITGEHRSGDKRARDPYRNPYETLTFFGLKEDMTVLEINATGGWYTEIIAPVVAEYGQVLCNDVGPRVPATESQGRSFNELAELIDADRELYGDAEVVEHQRGQFQAHRAGIGRSGADLQEHP